MRGLFRRTPATPANPATDASALGTTALALRMHAGAVVPAGCVGVVFDKGGRTRRAAQGERLALLEHESAFCFHPGPYSIDIMPFASAPELGLHLAFAIDAPDPRVPQQRFDLFLASEAEAAVTLSAIGAAIESTLQRELAQGNLELAPCTSLDEWNAFRAGLNQLLYTRFGLTVDDCVPVDLGDTVDYAQMLLARVHEPVQATRPGQKMAPAPVDAALADRHALRRLFLELPGVTCALRLACLPPGQLQFGQRQALLQRLDQVALSVATMPALTLAAPGQSLPTAQVQARARHAISAAAALDEAWSMVARLADAAHVDDADRIVANLEHHCAGRRRSAPEGGDA